MLSLLLFLTSKGENHILYPMSWWLLQFITLLSARIASGAAIGYQMTSLKGPCVVGFNPNRTVSKSVKMLFVFHHLVPFGPALEVAWLFLPAFFSLGAHRIEGFLIISVHSTLKNWGCWIYSKTMRTLGCELMYFYLPAYKQRKWCRISCFLWESWHKGVQSCTRNLPDLPFIFYVPHWTGVRKF